MISGKAVGFFARVQQNSKLELRATLRLVAQRVRGVGDEEYRPENGEGDGGLPWALLRGGDDVALAQAEGDERGEQAPGDGSDAGRIKDRGQGGGGAAPKPKTPPLRGQGFEIEVGEESQHA